MTPQLGQIINRPARLHLLAEHIVFLKLENPPIFLVLSSSVQINNDDLQWTLSLWPN